MKRGKAAAEWKEMRGKGGRRMEGGADETPDHQVRVIGTSKTYFLFRQKKHMITMLFIMILQQNQTRWISVKYLTKQPHSVTEAHQKS
ncbi:Protein of unknown function [Gryllus bimaculatus]|nr:Protein of unknown function [Gryllus bimaculatus]